MRFGENWRRMGLGDAVGFGVFGALLCWVMLRGF